MLFSEKEQNQLEKQENEICQNQKEKKMIHKTTTEDEAEEVRVKFKKEERRTINAIP